MKTLPTSRALTLSLLTTLCLACPGGDGEEEGVDTGGFDLEEPDLSGTRDAGTEDPDADAIADAGSPEEDAGDDAQDAGSPDEDAGVGEEDAGMQDADMGMGGDPDGPLLDTPLGGMSRPAKVYIPRDYDGTTELPLVVALHGYGGNEDSVGRYFSLTRNVEDRDFILVTPQGTQDFIGTRFWNATPACCDGFNSGVDDAGYLRGLIEEAIARYSIDEGRIYMAGYSNGGFMSYRMACESADYVTGIFVLAGGTFKDETLCQPAQPVQILHLHGTDDQTIAYGGGAAYPTAPMHPGAVETVETWAAYNGCQATPVDLDAADVDAVTVETATVTGFDGCPDDGLVELWTLDGAPHNPGMPRTIGTYILDRFFAIDRTP